MSMPTSLRTISILMLLAGASLGVFAGRSLLGDASDPPIGSDRGVEESVRLFRERYHLTEPQADEVRQVLREHDRRVRSKLNELRRRHEAEFRSISEDADARIRTILAEAGR
jgi:hypothetical protein